jgi:hypothetical protein
MIDPKTVPPAGHDDDDRPRTWQDVLAERPAWQDERGTWAEVT